MKEYDDMKGVSWKHQSPMEFMNSNKAIVDGVEYQVSACHFNQNLQGSGSLFMQILVEKNSIVPPNLYPFGEGFLFYIDVPSVHLKREEDLIQIEFDEPDRDSCVSVYTGEHDGIVNVRASLRKIEGSWQLHMTGVIDLINQKQNFALTCDAISFHGSDFKWLG